MSKTLFNWLIDHWKISGPTNWFYLNMAMQGEGTPDVMWWWQDK
jgi:hypothetical protein